jgi:D-3-phosphoglycerate dehydrogenase
MTFGTVGLGRIAREILARARPFGFSLAAYDPYVADEVFEHSGVRRVSLDELFCEADILSLNSPLTEETRHIVNAESLARMKPTAIVVNTARGQLIDTPALAEALQNRRIAYAGLDVFEEEPIGDDNPLLSLENAVLTSHVSYYSEVSISALQRFAAEEIVRFFKGEEVRNRVA